MSALDAVNHEACAGTAQRLTDEEILKRLARLPRWSLTGDRLRRTARFDSFAGSAEFAAALAALAEQRNHHPSYRIDKRTVEVELWTRKMSCVTTLDVELAGEIESLLEARGR